MKTLDEKQKEFIEMFVSLDDWRERFQYLLDIGSELPALPEELKVARNRINNCQSLTFFCVRIIDGKLSVDGWSNASIPSGLIAMLKNIFEGCTPEDLQTTEINFHTETGLLDNLTGLRREGLLEMLEKIKSSRL